MRIQFILSCQKGTIIPINYQSEISNWIFDAFAKAGPEVSSSIAAMGYDVAARNYRQFTFSPLAIYPYEMDQIRQEFKLLGVQVKLNVSIYIDPSLEHHVVGLFRQTPLQLGMLEGNPAYFEVKHWQVLPRPYFKETHQFKAVSPLSVSNVDDSIPMAPGMAPLPESENYDINFFTHLVRRFKAAYQYRSLNNLKVLDPAFPLHFRLMGQAKSRLIHLKHNAEQLTQLRGFICDFEVSMPISAMEYCYYAGFGEYPHLGFGYVDFRPANER